MNHILGTSPPGRVPPGAGVDLETEDIGEEDNIQNIIRTSIGADNAEAVLGAYTAIHFPDVIGPRDAIGVCSTK